MKQNFLSPVDFKMTVKRLPNTEFFVQRANIPSLLMNPTQRQTPLAMLYQPGDTLSYGELTVTLRLDENMDSYMEIYNWMTHMAGPDRYTAYKNMIEGEGLYTDIELTIMNSSKNPAVGFTFHDCFPISIGDVQLDITSPDILFATADVSFRYTQFIAEKVT